MYEDGDLSKNEYKDKTKKLLNIDKANISSS